MSNMTSTPDTDGRLAGEQVADEVTDHRRDHDDRPAHGGGAALGRVPGRALLPDQLAVAAPGEDPDGQRRAEQRKQQRHPGRQQDGPHCDASPVRARATRSSPALRDAFTRTTSPGASWFRSASRAAPASAAWISSPAQAGLGLGPGQHRRGFVADHDKSGQPGPRRVPPGLLVPGRGGGAQLAHRPEHRERAAAAGQHGQRVQRGPDRLGVGVVGVVEHGDPVRPLGHLHPPPAARLGGGQPRGDLIHRHAQLTGQGRCGERVLHVVHAEQPQLNERPCPAGHAAGTPVGRGHRAGHRRPGRRRRPIGRT